MSDDEKYSGGSLGLGGYGSAAQGDEGEIRRLRELTAGREQAESPAPRPSYAPILALVLLLFLLGMVWTTKAFLLPTSTISDLMIQVESMVSSLGVATEPTVIIPASSEEPAPADSKHAKRGKRPAGSAGSRTAQGTGSAELGPADSEGEPEALAAAPAPPRPFNVEVVDSERRLEPRYTDRTVNLSVQGGRTQRVPVDASNLERMSTRPPTVLVREGSVQGSVVLRAVIDRQGYIRELAVVRGPADMAAAAIEAARHWRFKPYLQNGKPVETETLITVDFNISAQ